MAGQKSRVIIIVASYIIINVLATYVCISSASVAMVLRVSTCEGASTDNSVANIPFHPPAIHIPFPNMDLVKKSMLNTCVSNHGLVDGNG